MNEATQKNTALTLPLAAMRDIAIYPKMTVSVDIGRDASVAAVRLAMRRDRYLVCVMQKDGKKEDIDLSNLYEYGTVVKVNQMLQLPGGLVRILVEGVSRVHVVHAEMKETCISAEGRGVSSPAHQEFLRMDEKYRQGNAGRPDEPAETDR